MRAQLELLAKGLYKGPIDGKMSPEFRSALRDFQIRQGLAATGSMDNQTLARLGIAY